MHAVVRTPMAEVLFHSRAESAALFTRNGATYEDSDLYCFAYVSADGSIEVGATAYAGDNSVVLE